MKKHVYLSLIWGLFFLIMPALRVHAQPLSGYCGREVVYNNDSTNLTWQVDLTQRTLIIMGNGPMKDYSVDTKAPWYDWRNNIDLVEIGNGVTTIGSYAMYEVMMDSVRFGSGIEYIYNYAFNNCDSLTSVYLGNNVRFIDNYAFASNDSLRVVDFGESPADIEYYAFAWNNAIHTVRCSRVKSIRWRVFEDCRSLVNLNLGDSLYHLGDHAFTGCSSLRKVFIPASVQQIDGGVFTYATVLDSIVVATANPSFNSNGNCNAIMRNSDNYLVNGCRNTIIPTHTKGIGYAAFEGCVGLQSAIIPDGAEYVGTYAFQDCAGLQTVSFPNSIRTSDCFAFYNCSSLNTPVYNNHLFAYLPHSYKGSYTMLNTIREICCGALMNCDSLTTITLSDSLERIRSSAFQGCQSLASLIIPDEVTDIESSAFTDCRSLNTIAFPAKLNNLGEYVLTGCYNLQHIIWNARDAHLSWLFYSDYTEEQIRDQISWYHPFYNIRQQIQTFTFGDSVRVIPRYLCYEMENLTSLSFGCEVDSIEQHVFEGCNGIKSIHWNARSFKDPYLSVYSPFYPIRDSITSFTFGDSVHHIPAYICNGMSNLHQLVIPAKVSSIGEYAFRHMGTLDSISVNLANTHYDSRGNCNALIETASNNLLLGNYKTRIPADIQGIDACAFRNVRNLTTAIIPEGVSFIGKEAFNGCKDLKNLSLPRKLGAINDYTFQDCDSLYNITLPDSLWFIGLRAFANCTHLQALTLPESTELIDQYAFSGCTGLQAINCNAAVPPSIQQTTFRGSSCPIYVPCPSINDYRTAYIWSDYGSRVVGQFYHTLSARPNDYSFGRVIIQQQPDCEHNAILLAEPAVGHEFVSWQDTLGNVLSTDTQYEFLLDKDISIVAHFIKNIVALKDAEQLIRVRVYNRDILVFSETNDEVSLFDLTGSKVDATSLLAGTETTLHAPTAGIYIVQTGQQVQKVIVQ